MDDRSILETIQDSFLNLVEEAVDYIPRVLAALVLLLVGFIVARFVSKLLGKLVNMIEKDKRVTKAANSLGLTVDRASNVVELAAKWSILLIFFSAAVDALGIAVLTETFKQLLGYVPNIFAAVVIAGFSFILANIVKDIVRQSLAHTQIKTYAFLPSAARIAVLIFGLPLAAAQLGLDLSIINDNLTVIVAGFMLALGLAFGLGGKEVAGRIVTDFYNDWKE